MFPRNPFDPASLKLALVALILLGGVPFMAFAQQGEASPDAAATDAAEAAGPSQDEILFAFGYALGANTPLAMGFSMEEVDLVIEGIRAAVAGEEEPGDMQTLMLEVQRMIQDKVQAAQAEEQAQAEVQAQENVAAGAEYLAEKKEQDPEIQSTESGLHYKVIEAGEGPKPDPQDSVRVHYHGTLIDGTVFDSSRDRGQPATFPLNGVIPGFSEGLQLVGEGGRIVLMVPSDLGYGNQARGAIPPGSLLTFDVEVIEVIEASGGERQAPGFTPPPPPQGRPASGPPDYIPEPPSAEQRAAAIEAARKEMERRRQLRDAEEKPEAEEEPESGSQPE